MHKGHSLVKQNRQNRQFVFNFHEAKCALYQKIFVILQRLKYLLAREVEMCRHYGVYGRENVKIAKI